jgi:DNA-binding transcriptional regulator YiaG
MSDSNKMSENIKNKKRGSMNKSEMKTPGQRLKYVREKLLKLSRSEIGEKHGLSKDTLAAWENEKIQISEKGLERCIKIFSAENLIVSREWLLIGKGLDPSFSFDLSRYFGLPAETESKEEVEDDSTCIIKEINFFRSSSKNAVTGILSTDDMLPLYARGDYVGGKLRYGKEISECIGKDCIVHTKGGEIYIRRLLKSPNGKGYNLACINPSWHGSSEPVLFNVDIESAAPIIWHRRLNP